jgi:outer membrane protein assembly factor BamB
VGGFSVLSTPSGQQLSWINATRADAPHDGVVVFRATAPAVPSAPADGSDYAGDAVAFYADSAQSAAQSLADPAIGTFNYRICNRDPNLVYSSCNSGFWNNSGWLDSVVAPTGGWSHALGGQMLLLPGLIPGGRLGVVSNAPDVTLLDVATGAKAFPSVALPALPSVGSPIVKIADGRQLLFAADQAGGVTAVDVSTGAVAWSVSKPGESFVAGVSGAVRQHAAPAFQSAYSSDVLFIGSVMGNLFALDAATGKTLWSLALGAPIYSKLTYDPIHNWLVIPTDVGGVAALDLTGSSEIGLPPTWAQGWSNPGGSYTLGCSRSAQLICATKTGGVRFLDPASGVVVASYEPDAGAPSYMKLPPSTIWPYAGGVVVTNAKAVLRFTVSGSALTLAASWVPGSTLSPMQLFQSANTIYLAASDRKVHKLALPALTEVNSVSVPSQAPSSLLGPPNYDVTQDLFIFGTSDSHLWAVKAF